ncbi:hypothetical protein PybrP1_012357 [[Pythium] brassicae (nom. inval.)]|nr:hypothetical protein PybrP1_012357 [[Pythium] brassicae (nom. inval.)]
MQVGEEVRVHRTALPGFAPFPTWNGTLATASGARDGRCSLLRENGDLLLLRYTEDGEKPVLRVEKVLRPPLPSPPASFSQCWAADGSVFVCARDRHVTVHDTRRGFAPLLSTQLRFSVATIDIACWSHSASSDAERVYLLVVGSAFGAFLHRVTLPGSTNSNQSYDTSSSASSDAAATGVLPPVAAAYEDTPVCVARFSHDGATVALGTVDGRLFVRQLRRRGPDSALLGAFGAEVFTKVLAAPRVTSISFAPCDSKLAAATRKGNVYVLVRDAEADATALDAWCLHPPCRELSSNPTPPPAAAGVAGAMQTLVCWWGSARSSALVVASRAANYRLELLDAVSGNLVRSVQVASRRRSALGDGEASVAPPPAAGDDLLTGVSCVSVPGADGAARQRLLCHDTRSSLSVIEWSGLDVWVG